MKPTELYIIILAGGTGTRMQSELPKQYHTIDGKEVLAHTIAIFVETVPTASIIVVIHPDYMYKQESYQMFFPTADILFVTGGDTRFQSSKNGLAHCPDSGVVFIHDAARPLVSEKLITDLHTAAQSHGNAIPCTGVNQSLREVDGDRNWPASREDFRQIQTPQAFKSTVIKNAYNTEYEDKFTDDATVVESAGHSIRLIEGDETNIKITKPADLKYVEFLMQQ